MKTITIDDDSRYILIVEDKKGRLPDEKIQKLNKHIIEWWANTDQKFLVLHQRKEIKIRLERISIG